MDRMHRNSKARNIYKLTSSNEAKRSTRKTTNHITALCIAVNEVEWTIQLKELFCA